MGGVESTRRFRAKHTRALTSLRGSSTLPDLLSEAATSRISMAMTYRVHYSAAPIVRDFRQFIVAIILTHRRKFELFLLKILVMMPLLASKKRTFVAIVHYS